MTDILPTSDLGAVAESSLVSHFIAYISNKENLEKLQGVTRDSTHSRYLQLGKAPDEAPELGGFEFKALQTRSDEDNVFKVSRDGESIILRWVNNRSDLSATIEQIRSDPILKKYVAVTHCTTLMKDDGAGNLQKHNLIIGDFYKQGNLKDYLEKIEDPLERASRVLDFTGQLFDMLIAFSEKELLPQKKIAWFDMLIAFFQKKSLSQKKIAWADLKLTNLLVDDHGCLKISDLKGLIQVNKLSAVPLSDFSAYTTAQYIPDNLFDGASKRADQKNKLIDFNKFFSYQMGLAIYEMLVPGFPKSPLDLNSDISMKIKEIIKSCTKLNEEERPALSKVKTQFVNYTNDLFFACQVDLLKIEMDTVSVALEKHDDLDKDSQFAEDDKNCHKEIFAVKQDIDKWTSLADEEHLNAYSTAKAKANVDLIQEFIKKREDSDPATINAPPVLEKVELLPLPVPRVVVVPPAAVVPTVADITERNIQPNLPRPISQSTHYNHAQTRTLIAKAVVVAMGVLATALAFAAFGPLAAVIAIGFTALTYAAVAEKPEKAEKPMRAPGASSLFPAPKPVISEPTSSPTLTSRGG